MKRVVVLFLVGALGLGCTGCDTAGSNNTQMNSDTESGFESQKGTDTESEIESETESEIENQITDANEILTKVWVTYEENEKFYAAGGHFENYTDGGPAAYDITKAADLELSYCIPPECVALIDDAATLLHSLNVNIFSGAAYHLRDMADMQTVIDGIKSKTLSNQWLGGSPDTLIIVMVGDEYVVTAFGDGGIVSNFKAKLLAVYEGAAQVVVEEAI